MRDGALKLTCYWTLARAAGNLATVAVYIDKIKRNPTVYKGMTRRSSE